MNKYFFNFKNGKIISGYFFYEDPERKFYYIDAGDWDIMPVPYSEMRSIEFIDDRCVTYLIEVLRKEGIVK